MSAPDVMPVLDPECTDPNNLVYTHIYPTMRVPDTEMEQSTIICMAVNIDTPLSNTNKLSRRATLTVRLHTHQDQQRVTEGPARGYTRLDYLSGAVENAVRSINARSGISDIDLISNVEDQLDARHPCRVLKFRANVADINCNG